MNLSIDAFDQEGQFLTAEISEIVHGHDMAFVPGQNFTIIDDSDGSKHLAVFVDRVTNNEHEVLLWKYLAGGSQPIVIFND